MQAQELMTRSVDIVDPNTRIIDAAEKMRADHVGALPVCENDRLIGMVTDRDITVRAVAEGRSGGTTVVRHVMSEGIYYCFEDASVEQVARIMAEHQVRRVPVVNHDKRLVGIIALADLGRHTDEIPQAVTEALKGISEPTNVPRR